MNGHSAWENEFLESIKRGFENVQICTPLNQNNAEICNLQKPAIEK